MGQFNRLIMIDYTNTNIEYVSVHTVGNKTNSEELYLSKSLLDTSELKVRELLFKFFLKPFENPVFYSFSFTNDDFTLNPIFNFVSKIFDNSKNFHLNSINIAKHLYELSIHPQIKSGDLFIAHFLDISIDDELTDAIGIFKSENRQAFLKLDSSKEDFTIRCIDGINIEKLDKGCLIFNTDEDSGFKVCIIDKSNKSIEAQYWRDSFLQIKPCSDEYHHTKEFMNITKNFVAKQLTEEFEVSRADQIDMLNRSVEYFKTHDTFNKKDFEQNVFQDTGIINSFRSYDESYRETHSIDLENSFGISSQAVKKQARIFKSVLKLDKNFHIYIHGNKDLIEQGVEKDGRKFYKIYFENET
ncbi:MAG TPA: nucleoid-associated protein [Bacteroidales bacterium]|nr:nucleoid-associated protein [Bacteroidales bacterium]